MFRLAARINELRGSRHTCISKFLHRHSQFAGQNIAARRVDSSLPEFHIHGLEDIRRGEEGVITEKGGNQHLCLVNSGEVL